jgi:transcriptional regulator with XRE-family HTH domain
VDQYQLIRHLYSVEGASKREIARRLGISRNTVAWYCEGANVPWERKPVAGKATVTTLDIREFIRQCFEQDKRAPRKHQSNPIFLSKQKSQVLRLDYYHHFGGGEGSRTPVRKQTSKSFYECSLRFSFA